MIALLLTACASLSTGTQVNDEPWSSPSTADTADTADTGAGGTDSPPVQDSGPPVDPLDEDDAEITGVTIPTAMTCGESADGIVTVRNTGSATWTSDAGYKLGAVGDEDLLLTGDVRVWLDSGDQVEPGREHAFVLPLQAPDDWAGTTTTDWQMVHEAVRWFGEETAVTVEITCDAPPAEEQLDLPDGSDVVDAVAAERPDLLAASCVEDGGNNDFLDLVVDRLRQSDTRWGYNWKRGNTGDLSQDVVDYHWGSDTREGSPNVYIIDMIVGHCGPNPEPGWMDQTQATADAGTIGRWTGNGRF